jgi:hypothetical protein
VMTHTLFRTCICIMQNLTLDMKSFAMQLGWMFDMWRKDKDGRDKLQTLKGHVDVPAADHTAAIIERLVSQLVVNAQTYKVLRLKTASHCHLALQCWWP